MVPIILLSGILGSVSLDLGRSPTITLPTWINLSPYPFNDLFQDGPPRVSSHDLRELWETGEYFGPGWAVVDLGWKSLTWSSEPNRSWDPMSPRKDRWIWGPDGSCTYTIEEFNSPWWTTTFVQHWDSKSYRYHWTPTPSPNTLSPIVVCAVCAAFRRRR